MKRRKRATTDASLEIAENGYGVDMHDGLGCYAYESIKRFNHCIKK